MTKEFHRIAPALAAAVALAACGDSSPGYQPEHEFRTVHANGLDVGYFEVGTGPLVLLLHGFPDTAHTWDAIAPSIAAAGFRVVAPFDRGYAPTSVPARDATTTDLGNDVLGLIAALGEERAIVIGHDWGALAACTAAAIGPTHVSRLVTIAIPHPIALFKHPEIPLSPHFVELAAPDAAATVRADGFRYVDELITRWSPHWNRPPGTSDAVKNTFRSPGTLEAALGYYRTTMAQLPPELLQPLAVPTLSFYGTDDHAVDPRVFADQQAAFTGPLELVPEPTGHFVQNEATDDFVAHVLAFLARP